MRTSESISNISPALLKAQKEIGAAKKEANNPFFHSRYADLGSIMEVCKKPLNDNDIAVLQPVGLDDQGHQYVETVLLHSSGEFISDRMMLDVPKKLAKPEGLEPYLTPDPQVQGSAISYARRYSLQSMLFIPSEDDDGEKATTHAIPRTVALPIPTSSEKITEPQRAAIFAITKSQGITEEEFKLDFGVSSIAGLTKLRASEIISSLNKK